MENWFDLIFIYLFYLFQDNKSSKGALNGISWLSDAKCKNIF